MCRMLLDLDLTGRPVWNRRLAEEWRMFPSLSPHFAPSALSRKPVLMTLNSNPISHSGAFQLPGSSVLPRAGRETCPVLDPSSRGTERSFVPAAAIPDRLVCESGVDVCLSSTFFSASHFLSRPHSIECSDGWMYLPHREYEVETTARKLLLCYTYR